MRPEHVVLALALLVSSAAAQTFAELGLRHFPDVGPLLTVCAADFDQDGDQDLYVSGIDLNDLPVETILWNDGHAVFTADRSFLPPSVVSAQNSWASDWDGDGDPDLLLQSTRLLSGGTRISLYRNDSTGLTEITHTLPASFANNAVNDVRLLDLEGDSDLDIVVCDATRLVLLRNDGAAGFTDVSSRIPQVTNMPSWLGVIDVDTDADPDLFVWTNTGRWLLENDGTGGFRDVSASGLVGVSPGTLMLAVADLDRDGDDDALALAPGFRLVRLVNDGAGRLTQVPYTQPFILAAQARAVTPADLDGDGDLDFAVAQAFWTQDGVWLNDGTGGLTEVILPAKGAGSVDGTVADLDGNGTPDVVVAAATVVTAQARQPFAFLNDGAANFTPTTDVLLTGGQFASGDVDADGDVDLLSGAGLFLNDGAGALRRAPFGQTPPLSTVFSLSDIVTGDVDGDGDLDVVLAHGNLLGASAALWTNDGAGNFTDASGNLPWAQLDTADAELADLDADGDLDLLLADATGQHRLYVNDGTGVFSDASTRLPLLPPAAHLAVADVDGDGDLDSLWSLAGSGLLALANNDGAGNFALSGSLPRSQVGAPIAFADLDHDGDYDLVVANPHLATLEALQNDGTGTFTTWRARVLPPLTAPARDLDVIDVENDGDLNLVVTTANGPVLLRDDGTGTYLAEPAANGLPESGGSFHVADLDRDGRDDLVWSHVDLIGRWNTTARVLRNTHRHTHLPHLRGLGDTLTIEFRATPASGTHQAIGLLAAGLSAAPIPTVFGAFLLDPTLFLSLAAVPIAPSTGLGTKALVVPVLPSLIGAELFVQAIVFDPGNLFDSALTNAARTVVQR